MEQEQYQTNKDRSDRERLTSHTSSAATRRRFVKTLGAGTGMIGLAGCVNPLSSGSSNDKIKVGTTFPLTGGTAALGKPAKRGIKTKIDEINNNGGINGTKLTIVSKDATSAEEGQSAAKDLASKNVDLIIGSLISSMGYAVSRVANRENIPYIETQAAGQNITSEGLKNVFRVNSSAKQYARDTINSIKYVSKNVLNKDPNSLTWANIHEDSLFGTSTNKFLTKWNKDITGMKKIQTTDYSADINDMTSIVAKLKDNDPDVFTQAGYVDDVTLFWKTARNKDYTPPLPLGIGSGYLDSTVPESIGNSFRGVLGIGVPATHTDPEFASVSEFRDKYKKEYNDIQGWSFAITSYGGMEIIRDMLKASGGDTNVEAFRKAALDLKKPVNTYASGSGVKFNDNGQNVRAQYSVSQWKKNDNGDLETYCVWPDSGRMDGVSIDFIPRPAWSKMTK